MRTRKHKPHIALILSVSLVWLILSAGSNVALSAWQPPIGIPVPSFGIEETYRMYDAPANRNPGLTYTQNSEGGFYTHYVDNTHPSAINSGNPYGTETVPRLTPPPPDLPAGSVVEIHGGPYTSSVLIKGYGTPALPIFVRGVDTAGNTPYFNGFLHPEGTYLIVEGLSASGCLVMGENGGTRDSNYVSVRANDIYPLDKVTSGSVGVAGEYSSSADPPQRADNVVIYNNTVHDFGDVNTPEDDDWGQITVSYFSNDVWIIDNEIYGSTGGGVGVNGGKYDPPILCERIYVGRNYIHDTRAYGLWAKHGKDIVFSQNKIHDVNSKPDWAEEGKGMGYQYWPYSVWYIFNEIHNCVRGFAGETGDEYHKSPGAPGPPQIYLIGNLIYGYEEPEKEDWKTLNWAGIASSGTSSTHIIGNTVHSYPWGMRLNDLDEFIIMNNIIADVNETKGHLRIEAEVAPSCVLENNLFYQSGGPVVINWGGPIFNDMDVLRAQTSTGEGCIIGDPQFMDAVGGNFNLLSESPAIDNGTLSDVYQTFYDTFGVDIRKDIEGRTRPQGVEWDIGAYEYILSAITDLSVSGTSQNSVTFVWTVPGEEGYTGKPARYDIRYATSPLTDANWDTATQVQGEPVPGDFGDEQSFTLTDLNPGTTYYITIKTSNETGSTTSSLSNVISATTATSGNHAPVLEPIGNRSVIENEPFTLVISATDADAGDTLTYSATNIPTGADFDEVTQTFTWTPTSSQSGTYQVTFQVTDSQVNVSETIKITVTGIQSTLTFLPTIGGSTIPVEGSHSYDEGTPVSIQATADDHYHFVNWTGTAVGAGKVENPNANSTTVTADADYTIQANFDPDQSTLTFLPTIGGSTIPVEGSHSYNEGTPVSIQATADNNYYFVNWTGTAVDAGKVANPNAASTTITADADYTIRSNFGESDGIAPTVTNRSPDANDIQVPLNSLIILHVTDAGIGVKASSVIIELNGDTIYTGGDTYYDSATGTCRRIGTIADYTYAYQSSQTFDFDESKTVTVNATDLAGIAMTEESYSFRTEMRSFGQNKQVDSTVEGLDKAAPSTARDSSGNIWAVWHAGPTDSRDIYVAKLSVNEEYFGDINKIRGSTSDQCNPVIAIGSDNKLYVAWQDNRQADDNNQGEWDIYISTSVDGISWSTETRVNDPNQDNQVNPAIVIDGQSPNYAHVVWQDDRAGNQDICIATSSDGFATKTVTQITSNTFDQVEPAVAADSANTIYVVWTDGRNSSNDIYGAASNNSWTNVPIVSNTNSQSSPAIAAESAGSILHLLWVDDTSGDNDIYYASSNGLPGSPLTGSSIIDDSSGADQLDPTIAVTGSTDNNLKVFACWQDWRDADTDLYFAELSSGSGTNVFVGDSGSNADQGEPAIGIGEYDHPYIIWADNRSTNTDIYYAGNTFIEPIALASELVTASASSSTIVGTDPQAITAIDDVSIVVPVGACSYDVTITVTKIANLPAFAALCLGGYDFGPSGIQFSQPVTITIPYAFSGSDDLVTPWFSTLSGTLSQQGITDIQDIPISLSLHALSFKTTHFTAFFLLEGGSTAAIISGGGGGGGCSVSASGEGNIIEYIIPYIALAVVMAILKMWDARDRKARDMSAGKC